MASSGTAAITPSSPGCDHPLWLERHSRLRLCSEADAHGPGIQRSAWELLEDVETRSWGKAIREMGDSIPFPWFGDHEGEVHSRTLGELPVRSYREPQVRLVGETATQPVQEIVGVDEKLRLNRECDGRWPRTSAGPQQHPNTSVERNKWIATGTGSAATARLVGAVVPLLMLSCI